MDRKLMLDFPKKIVVAKNKRKFKKEYLWGYLFIASPIVGFLLFAFLPMLFSIYVSFTEFDLYSPARFNGLENYKQLFQDDIFIKTVGNTFYAALGIPIGMIFSLMIAIALNQRIKGLTFFRTAFFLPTVCSIVALTLLWKWIFNSDFGLLNILLSYIGVSGPAWLSDEHWAMPAMIIQGVWGGLGVNMILYLAALQSVPKDLYEAAEIDGANGWHKLIYITIPSISPTTFFILVTSIIGALQDFQRFMIMTEGGPNYATTTVVYYLFLNAFRYMKMGYASAMAWVLGIIILIITIINFKLSKKWVHY
ncbi:carbohydrate ABC transporter permease [Geobacillus zalihae]|nr:sugar ABC transporter permease [Geobacillus zalihae]